MYIYVVFEIQIHTPPIQVPLLWFRPLLCSARGKTKSEKFQSCVCIYIYIYVYIWFVDKKRKFFASVQKSRDLEKEDFYRNPSCSFSLFARASRHSQENKLSAKGYCLSRVSITPLSFVVSFSPGPSFSRIRCRYSNARRRRDIEKHGFPRRIRKIRRPVASNNQRSNTRILERTVIY